ncbi:MAG TPA: hypothetical protein VME17_13265 [Bryobacteraceae bacterium]|nr:hypothetical protein [Bryobacteraceae bacterium]
MQVNDPAFYDQVIRRITRIILVLGVAGAIGVAAAKGLKSGLAFLIGSAISYTSFHGWRRLVDVLVPTAKKRTPTFFVFRLVALVAIAYAIIKILGLSIAAAALGLLVSGAAVVLELVYELIYAS